MAFATTPSPAGRTDSGEEIETAYEKLDETARADRLTTLGQLAAGLSHELAQPLLAAHNYITVAISTCAKHDVKEAELVEALEGVHSQINRAIQIVKRIQSFIVRRTPTRAPFDLNNTVHEVVSLLRHEYVEQKATVRLNLDSTIPLVSADHTLIQQVILNLLRNAVDAIAANEPEARDIEVETALAPPEHVLLMVSDHGPGIDAEDPDTVFTAFYSTKPTGFGMGLSLSRTIVEANGGRIWAENRPTGGAMFSFTLPIVDGAKSWKS